MMLVKYVSLTAAVLVSATAVASADPVVRTRVAVVPNVAVNVDNARVDALGQDLAEALMHELDVDAIGGLEVRRKLPPAGLPADCLAKPDCARSVAAQVGADQLLFLVIVDTGGGAIQIDSTWVDPATGASAARPALDLANGTEAKEKFVANARRLLPDAPVKPEPVTHRAIGVAMTPEVPLHFTTPEKITAGGVVVGLGVAIGFGLTARSRWNACNDKACEDDRKDSIKTLNLVADIGNVVWVGSAIATAALYFTSGKESKFVVTPTEGGAAAALVGRF
jgi:hypothetical protein